MKKQYTWVDSLAYRDTDACEREWDQVGVDFGVLLQLRDEVARGHVALILVPVGRLLEERVDGLRRHGLGVLCGEHGRFSGHNSDESNARCSGRTPQN